MKRAERLEPVQRIASDAERRCAEKFGACEKRVSECELKLVDLQRYRDEYGQGFHARAAAGFSASALRDYQAFIARLSDAIKQQQHIVDKARADRDAAKREWQQAATRVKAMSHVVEGWQAEERKAADKREQREADERATRARHSDRTGNR